MTPSRNMSQSVSRYEPRPSPRSAQSHSPGFEMPPMPVPTPSPSHASVASTNTNKHSARRPRSTNRAWTMSDEIKEYEERVKAARSELQVLQQTHTQLTQKLMSANSLNDTLQQRLEAGRQEAAKAKSDHDRTVAELQDVETQIHALNEVGTPTGRG
mgnify:CR=1 FL=1